MKIIALLMIILALNSCTKEMCYRTSSEPLTYEDVKNTSYLPVYIKYDIGFATTITITAANNDTSDYTYTDFGYYPDSTNTTNYIKEIAIEGIIWKGPVQKILNYSDTPNRDSTKLSIRYTSEYNLVNISSGRRSMDGFVYFKVNRANDNNKIFESYSLYNNYVAATIYQQKPTNTEKEYSYAIYPSVRIKNIWGITETRLLGKIINAIVRKSAEKTIIYYNRY